MSPEVMGASVWLGRIVLGLLVVATVAMIGYVIYYYIARGVFAPTRRSIARVVLKQQREEEVDAPRSLFGSYWLTSILSGLLRGADYDPTITLYHSWDYFITFEFDGRRQEFAVPEEPYASVSEGDEGLLVYKGNLFKHFIPGALRAEEIVPPQFSNPPTQPHSG